MNKKSKKLVGASLAGVMSVATAAGAAGAVDQLKVVNASVAKDVQAVHAKVEHITYSLKNNYLGLKNVGQFQAYIKEAKALNAKIPNGSSKDKYADRINRAEALINAAARVNQVEKSMGANAPIIKNVPQWEQYIDLAKEDLAKVDLGVFKAQYNELLERTAQRSTAINQVKADYDKAVKAVEAIYKEAEELAKTDKDKALEKLKEAKTAGEKLNSHALKDEILKKIEELIKSVTDGIVKPEEPSNPNGGSNGGGGGSSTSDTKTVTIDNISDLNNATYNNKNVVIKLGANEKATITGLKAKNVEIANGSKVQFDKSEITTLTISGAGTEVVAVGSTKIATTNLKAGAILSQSQEVQRALSADNAVTRTTSTVAKFTNVKIATTSKVTVNADVASIVVEKENADVAVNAVVASIKVSAANADVNVSGTVTKIIVDSRATGTVLAGSGTIAEAEVNVKGVTIVTTNAPGKISGTQDKYVVGTEEAEKLAVKAINAATSTTIASVIDSNKLVLGLDLTAYSSLTSKKPVHDELVGKSFTTKKQVQDVFNLEVSKQAQKDVDAEVAKIKTITLDKGAKELTLPTVAKGYEVSIDSSTAENVIAIDGKITPPEAETAVKLVLTVTNTASKKTAKTGEITVTVAAKSKALVAGNVTVTNSSVAVTGLASGDTIKVYYKDKNDKEVSKTALAAKEGTTEKYSANVEGLTLSSKQELEVTVQSNDKYESNKLKVNAPEAQ